MAGKDPMTAFYNPHENRVARKEHKCTYCAEPISKGDGYVFQKGNYDGRWFESKMHPECFEDMCDIGDGEYMPYSNERPKADA
jgi:hypothetical protein